MKRIFLVLLVCVAAIGANAQWNSKESFTKNSTSFGTFYTTTRTVTTGADSATLTVSGQKQLTFMHYDTVAVAAASGQSSYIQYYATSDTANLPYSLLYTDSVTSKTVAATDIVSHIINGGECNPYRYWKIKYNPKGTQTVKWKVLVTGLNCY